MIELDTPGVTVTPIRQANGTDELAEVHFEDVAVDGTALVGPLGGGWRIALDILACERTAFAWLRHLHLRERFATLSADVERSGDVAVDLFALGCTTAAAVRQLGTGRFAGPEAAICKVALTMTEQRLFDLVLDTDPAFISDDRGDLGRWREEYLFSRIVSVYGGTRQVQLSTLSRMRFPDEAYVSAATAALDHDKPGWDLLDSLQFWSCTALRDSDERSAFAALFVAQGDTLRSTPALAGLLAMNGAPSERRPCAAYTASRGSDDVVLRTTPEAPHADVIVLELPDGVFTADPDALRAVETACVDPDVISTWRVEAGALRSTTATPLDDARLVVPRIAVALEILGAAQRAFELACDYARDRHQFGRPISDFQAVRHLLADGLVQISVLRDACELTLEQPSAERAILLKALAGRSGRAAVQTAQQVFGGIGFTAEHALHRYQARVLALDTVLGTSAELIRWLGVTGTVPVPPRPDHRD